MFTLAQSSFSTPRLTDKFAIHSSLGNKCFHSPFLASLRLPWCHRVPREGQHARQHVSAPNEGFFRTSSTSSRKQKVRQLRCVFNTIRSRLLDTNRQDDVASSRARRVRHVHRIGDAGEVQRQRLLRLRVGQQRRHPGGCVIRRTFKPASRHTQRGRDEQDQACFEVSEKQFGEQDEEVLEAVVSGTSIAGPLRTQTLKL